MSADEPLRINIDIDALGQSRVYSVAEGNMYIGDADSTVSTARKLAAIPARQASEKLLDMPGAERVAVLAEMSPPAAAARIENLPQLAAIDVFLNLDESLAVERLLAMNPSAARGIALAISEPSRTEFLSRLTFEQTLRLLGEIDEINGKGTFDLDVLKSFAPCLSVQTLAALICLLPAEASAQLLEADADRDFVTWIAITDLEARLSLLEHMPFEYIEKAFYATYEPTEDIRQLGMVLGTSIPQANEVIGALSVGRLAGFLAASHLGPDLYCAATPETRVNLMGDMTIQGLASMFPRLEGRLAECIWTTMAADQSRPYRAPLACRYIAAALTLSGINARELMDQLPRQYAAALWDSHWAYGVTQELETLGGNEACWRFSSFSELHKKEIAWYLSSELRNTMIQGLEIRQGDNPNYESDLKILRDASRTDRAPRFLR